MLKVGLTGGIGAGKSTVAHILEVLGVPVFKADDESKRLLQEDEEARTAVIAAFGPSIYPNGELDRKALAALVFPDGSRLRELNDIMHPLVRAHFTTWANAQEAPYVVMEAAILRETGGDRAMDHLCLVWANRATRTERVIKRDGLTAQDVERRMAHQGAETERPAIADTVIINDGLAMVIPQTLAMHSILLERSARLVAA